MGRDGDYFCRGDHDWAISIHAPRVGRDPRLVTAAQQQSAFQSTRPVWGATSPSLLNVRPFQISIHAPRVGRDETASHRQPSHTDFNPRAPCGARRHWQAIARSNRCISIHAPRVGRDSKFDDFTPSNLHKRYKRVLARPKNTREKGKIKQKLAYIHAFSAFLGCEGSGTFCALVLRTQYR